MFIFSVTSYYHIIMYVSMSVSILSSNGRCCVYLLFAGEGGAVKEHKTSFHAIARVVRNEGMFGLYNGYLCVFSWCY